MVDTLRTSLKQKRQQLDAVALQQAGDRLRHHLYDVLQACKLSSGHHVAGYFALGGEIPVDKILQDCRQQGAISCVPLMHHDTHTLSFAPFDHQTPIETRRWGIREPVVDVEHHISAKQLHVALVPLLACDAQGHRMGMGGGFYDRSFAHRQQTPPPTWLIGVAHAFQQVDSLKTEWWDVAMDAVVTDQGVLLPPAGMAR